MQLRLALGHEDDAIGTGLAQPGADAERGAAGQCLRPEQRDIDAAIRVAGGDALEGTDTALAQCAPQTLTGTVVARVTQICGVHPVAHVLLPAAD